jgi:predicted PolB exonuclease-like 3'-5' exonuclease
LLRNAPPTTQLAICHMSNLIVWDIETVPDLKGFAAANGHEGAGDDELRAAMGDKFPKHIYHSIICIGALVAHWEDGHWTVTALGAPHVGERPEKALISSFVDRIAELSPRLVTFNGSSPSSCRSRRTDKSSVGNTGVATLHRV